MSYFYTAHEDDGVFKRNVAMVTDYCLKGHPYAQAGYNMTYTGDILRYDLYSYSSHVLCIMYKSGEEWGKIYKCDTAINYSPTTSKHVRAFLKELALDVTFEELKKSFVDNGDDFMLII